MITIPGYTITETIHESVKTIVYRGYREENEQPVILKIPKAEFPTLEETTRFKQEYTAGTAVKAPLRSIGMLAQWIAADYADKLDDDGREQLDLLNEQVKHSQ
ncbi:MAG: hypothetical protein U7123_20140 [Potamolinea sp.]